jgi:hypothetical protein
MDCRIVRDPSHPSPREARNHVRTALPFQPRQRPAAAPRLPAFAHRRRLPWTASARNPTASRARSRTASTRPSRRRANPSPPPRPRGRQSARDCRSPHATPSAPPAPARKVGIGSGCLRQAGCAGWQQPGAGIRSFRHWRGPQRDAMRRRRAPDGQHTGWTRPKEARTRDGRRMAWRARQATPRGSPPWPRPLRCRRGRSPHGRRDGKLAHRPGSACRPAGSDCRVAGRSRRRRSTADARHELRKRHAAARLPDGGRKSLQNSALLPKTDLSARWAAATAGPDAQRHAGLPAPGPRVRRSRMAARSAMAAPEPAAPRLDALEARHDRRHGHLPAGLAHTHGAMHICVVATRRGRPRPRQAADLRAAGAVHGQPGAGRGRALPPIHDGASGCRRQGGRLAEALHA